MGSQHLGAGDQGDFVIAKLLKIQNFMGIGKGELTFTKPGLVLIEGINNSSPTSISNGASKSTIYEAIHWALWGTTKRGLKGDAVVNEEADKDCRVEFHFDDVVIIRTRKDAKLKNSLRIWKAGQEITKGTSFDTQIMIEQIVGMSEGTFSKVAHFGQGDVKAFAASTDKEFKTVFEEALGLTFFSEDHAKIKAEQKRLEAEITRIRDTIRVITEYEITNAEQSLEAAERAMAVWQTDFGSRVLEANSDKGRLELEERRAKEALDQCPANVEQYRQNLAVADATVSKFNDLAQQLNAKIERVSQEQYALTLKQEGVLTRQRKVAETASTLTNDGAKCEACGRAFGPQDIAAMLKRLQDESDKLEAEVAALDIETATVATSVANLTNLREQLAARAAEAAQAREQVIQNGADVARRQQLESDLQYASQRLSEARRRLQAIETESCPHRPIRDAQKANLDAARSKLSEHNALLSPLEERMALVNMLEATFGNGGLKSYVFDSVTPELNRIIYDNAMLLDDIEITVSTLKKLKSGEVREKFDIEVKNEHGASSFVGSSGGERQKINLALAVSFNALVRSMAASSLNFIFLDEVFESLDSGSAEPVMDLCFRITKEIPHVFLITHQSHFKSLVGDILTVSKTGRRGTFSY